MILLTDIRLVFTAYHYKDFFGAHDGARCPWYRPVSVHQIFQEAFVSLDRALCQVNTMCDLREFLLPVH